MTSATQFPIIAALFDNNAKWAAAVNAADPCFFPNSAANDQTPKVLWIGCSDSRVPESVILGCRPGDIFVARNIANQVLLDDNSALSVITYAIETVRVEHIIVAGHTVCGGAQACLKAASDPGSTPPPPLGDWLAPLTALAVRLQDETPGKVTELALIEANVREGIQNLLKTDAVKNAWRPRAGDGGKGPKLVAIHGVVYELEKGRVRDLEVSVVRP